MASFPSSHAWEVTGSGRGGRRWRQREWQGSMLWRCHVSRGDKTQDSFLAMQRAAWTQPVMGGHLQTRPSTQTHFTNTIIAHCQQNLFITASCFFDQSRSKKWKNLVIPPTAALPQGFDLWGFTSAWQIAKTERISLRFLWFCFVS